MDWSRYNRALQARDAHQVEHKRQRLLDRKIKNLEADELEMVLLHDRLLGLDD